MNNKKTMISEEGEIKINEEINQLRIEINELLSKRGKICKEINITKDYGSVDSITNAIHAKRTRISDLLLKLGTSVKVQKLEDEDLIDCGDYILIELYDENTEMINKRTMTIRLVGSSSNIDKEIKDVSINSPMGSALYASKVGTTKSYNVAERVFYVTSLEKSKTAPKKLNLTHKED